MQAIKAIYDGVHFTPKQPVPVQGRYEVVITFIEPTEIQKDASQTAQYKDVPSLPHKRGCMSGKMWMSDDFDAPLDDFEEYMK